MSQHSRHKESGICIVCERAEHRTDGVLRLNEGKQGESHLQRRESSDATSHLLQKTPLAMQSTCALSESTEDGSCLHNYVVTARRPTAVTHTAVGSITDAQAIDLVVGYSLYSSSSPSSLYTYTSQEKHHP